LKCVSKANLILDSQLPRVSTQDDVETVQSNVKRISEKLGLPTVVLRKVKNQYSANVRNIQNESTGVKGLCQKLGHPEIVLKNKNKEVVQNVESTGIELTDELDGLPVSLRTQRISEKLGLAVPNAKRNSSKAFEKLLQDENDDINENKEKLNKIDTIPESGSDNVEETGGSKSSQDNEDVNIKTAATFTKEFVEKRNSEEMENIPVNFGIRLKRISEKLGQSSETSVANLDQEKAKPFGAVVSEHCFPNFNNLQKNTIKNVSAVCGMIGNSGIEANRYNESEVILVEHNNNNYYYCEDSTKNTENAIPHLRGKFSNENGLRSSSNREEVKQNSAENINTNAEIKIENVELSNIDAREVSNITSRKSSEDTVNNELDTKHLSTTAIDQADNLQEDMVENVKLRSDYKLSGVLSRETSHTTRNIALGVGVGIVALAAFQLLKK